MTKQEILAHVDHTQLKAFASWPDIQTLCDQAIENKTASVCVPPCYVQPIKQTYGGQLAICTVIGFPLGYSVTAAKVAEAQQAVADGADEIDMVINIAFVKNGAYDKVADEIKAVRAATRGKILKVIVETCYLTEEEIIRLCEIVTDAQADYIKTSTGFGTAGATPENIRLFKKHIGPAVKMKAAGGIRSEADMVLYLNEGCDRLGTSSAIDLLSGGEAKGY